MNFATKFGHVILFDVPFAHRARTQEYAITVIAIITAEFIRGKERKVEIFYTTVPKTQLSVRSTHVRSEQLLGILSK